MEGGGNHRQELGRRGEDIACCYLTELGHTIIEKNLREGHLEIDIVSHDVSGIHFVEVKSRQKSIQAPPQYNVDHMKQRNIAKAARRFLKTRRGSRFRDEECSFDVIAVTFDGESALIEWFPQAYIPIYM